MARFSRLDENNFLTRTLASGRKSIETKVLWFLFIQSVRQEQDWTPTITTAEIANAVGKAGQSTVQNAITALRNAHLINSRRISNQGCQYRVALKEGELSPKPKIYKKSSSSRKRNIRMRHS